MRYLQILLLILITSNVQADPGYQGLPPDCWSEPRIVHVESSPLLQKLLKEQVLIEKVTVTAPVKFDIVSPNKAYSFKAIKDGRNESISIFAEKDHILKININKVYFVDDIKWINEKLIFFRIWWGRMMSTDIIFDVEKESIVYSEPAMDGANVFSEWSDKCRRLGGCKCIKKEENK